MIVTIEKAEEKFLDVLDVPTIEKEDRRCIHLRTSGLAGFEKNQTINFIHDNIDDQNGGVFVCEDGDFLITARCIGAPFVKILQNFIITHLKPRPAQTFELATLFEVKVDRSKIIKIVEEKLKTKQIKENAEREKQARIQAQKNRKIIIDTPIPDTLVDSLSQRRKDRKETEILVVEDDSFSRALVKKSLAEVGNISIAEDGRTALTQYFKKAPDILFLDIGLPDIDGHDVLAKILEHDPHAFIIMLSGKGDKDNIMKAIQNGAKGFVGKPFTREKLSQYIQKSPHIQTSNQ
ncbi:MAG: hypothetical protein COB36_07940 [Alphaproteobacteria bacterium]|nr:MAG: hypothetical protein COB36_07940 [Alphaproteobacteria bacterium]